jgi:hypothetical protein
MTTSTPRMTTGEQALNAALRAGFEVTRHGRDNYRGTYFHTLDHADGRSLHVYAVPTTGRFISAQGYGPWFTRVRAARSLPALGRLLEAAQAGTR